jgi:SAM-dependent methyltransferase
VLELGCGAGANIPLFRTFKVKYFGIDGSPTIVKQLHERYPDLANNIACGDFTTVQPFAGDFDLILDRASLTHNSTAAIARAIKLTFESLKTGGIFIGSDWFSTNHSDFESSEPSIDTLTRTNYKSGQFVGTGQVHFSDEAHLRELFSQFEIIFMEEKLMRRTEPKDGHQFASWNIVAKKPNT